MTAVVADKTGWFQQERQNNICQLHVLGKHDHVCAIDACSSSGLLLQPPEASAAYSQATIVGSNVTNTPVLPGQLLTALVFCRQKQTSTNISTRQPLLPV